MIVGKAIFTLLLSDTDLRGIVSNRIFPEVAQQDAVLPYVVYNISNNEPSDTKREPSKMDTAQVEVNLYSTSYTECIDMATHVRAALDRVTGTYSGVNVQSIQYLSEIIDFDEAQRAYNITSDYDVRVSRSDFEIAQGSPITGVKLGALSDVDTTGVTDGQVIAYDAAAQEWQPADGTGGVTELGQLDDVQFGQGGPESGDLLKYDGSEWTNDSLNKSEIGLGNVDNTSDVDKPVSTATQTELNAKANSADFSNVDNTSDADKPVSTATQTALNAKADTSAVPTDLNDLSDVSIVGTPVGNEALIYDTTAGAFKSKVSYTNRFEDEVEDGLQIATIFAERGYSVKSEGDGVFVDSQSDTPAAGKVIQRKIYHKTGFISDSDVIGDYILIHTFADDTAYADTVAVFDAFEDGATYGVPPFTLFQTWEQADEPTLLLDTYTGATGAYSLRKLRTVYTGDCIEVWNGSSYADIGFVDDELDTTALATHCGSNDGFVSKLYDQSGNTNTAAQTNTNNMPKIYDGITGYLNGMKFTPSSNTNLAVSVTFDMSDVSAALVAQADATGSYAIIDAHETSQFVYFTFGINNGNVRTVYRKNGNVSRSESLSAFDDLFLATMFADNTPTNDSYLDGNQMTGTNGPPSTANTTNNIRFGQRGSGSADFSGLIREFVVYFSEESDNRAGIESNIATYYNITI